MNLVTGAADLVGLPVANRLIAAGMEVIGTDARRPDRTLNCRFVEADLRDAPAVLALFGTYDITGGTWLNEGEVIEAAMRAVPKLKATTGDVPPLGLDGLKGPLDITLAARDLGYAPRTGIKEGIARYAAWRAAQ